MSAGFRRSLIKLACHALQATLPSSLQSWGWAVRYEAAAIVDDTKALLFTLDSLCGLMPRAIASHLHQLFASFIGERARFSAGSTMNLLDILDRPRVLGIICAIGAVLLGIIYMACADAPTRRRAILGSTLAHWLSA